MAEKQKVTETTDNGTATEVRKLYVERERFKGKEDGKEYWGYFARGTVRGREVKAGLIPPDKGGYEVLDLVFGGGEKTAELVVTPYEFKDEETDKVINGFNYTAHNVDAETGEIFDGNVKPARKSDKQILDMLLARLNVQGGKTA